MTAAPTSTRRPTSTSRLSPNTSADIDSSDSSCSYGSILSRIAMTARDNHNHFKPIIIKVSFLFLFSLCNLFFFAESFSQYGSGLATRGLVATTSPIGRRRRLGDSNDLPAADSTAATSTSLAATPVGATSDATVLATSLGYLIAVGSLILYTPIAVRLLRQRTADGLTLSTWWLKIISYSFSDVYGFTNGYPISTYVETLIITVEAFVVLILVAKYQNRMDTSFSASLAVYFLLVVMGITVAPPELISFGQASSALLNVAALIPQFRLNIQLQTAGDYSPVTASLAATGCLVRIFTTIQLANSDPLLLASFGLALLVNGSLLLQILYYGVLVERRTIWNVMAADLKQQQPSYAEAALGEENGVSDAEMIDVAKSKKDEDSGLVDQ